jgi:hypothetical protein
MGGHQYFTDRSWLYGKRSRSSSPVRHRKVRRCTECRQTPRCVPDQIAWTHAVDSVSYPYVQWKHQPIQDRRTTALDDLLGERNRPWTSLVRLASRLAERQESLRQYQYDLEAALKKSRQMLHCWQSIDVREDVVPLSALTKGYRSGLEYDLFRPFASKLQGRLGLKSGVIRRQRAQSAWAVARLGLRCAWLSINRNAQHTLEVRARQRALEMINVRCNHISMGIVNSRSFTRAIILARLRVAVRRALKRRVDQWRNCCDCGSRDWEECVEPV